MARPQLDSPTTSPRSNRRIEGGAKARPERDVITELLARLHPLPGNAAQEARAAIRAYCKRGDFGNLTTRKLLHSVSALTADKDAAVTAALATAAEKIRGHARPDSPPLVEYHENHYGRFFESHFIHRVVEDPPAAALQAGRTQAAFLRQEVAAFHDGLDEKKRAVFLRRFSANLNKDPRQWSPQTPEIAAFTAQASPTREALLELFEAPKTGYDIVKNQYLACRLGTFLQLRDASPDWMAAAGVKYPTLLQARTYGEVLAEAVKTDRFGIGLINQPAFPAVDQSIPAKSWTDDKMPDFVKLDEGHAPHFERRSMETGHPIVAGVSGSANILSHLDTHIVEHFDPQYDAQAAKLNHHLFLTLDGGHSLNEVAAVHHALKEWSHDTDPVGDEARRTQLIHRFRLNYNDLKSLVPQEAAAVDSKLEAALDATVERFTTFGHRRASIDGSEGYARSAVDRWMTDQNASLSTA